MKCVIIVTWLMYLTCNQYVQDEFTAIDSTTDEGSRMTCEKNMCASLGISGQSGTNQFLCQDLYKAWRDFDMLSFKLDTAKAYPL